MHLRRAVLLFAIVLGLTAIASSVAPPPRDVERTTTAPPPASTTAARPSGEELLRVEFAVPRRGPADSPPVAPGRHVIVEVTSREPGEVTIPRLGLSSNASAGAAATFDLLAPEPGRYDVLFTAPGRRPARVGTLVVAA